MIVKQDLHVLLVEDDPIIRLVETRQLEEMGCLVTAAADAETALEYCRATTHQPDLALLDIELGAGMDGIACARLLHERHALPILFLSSHVDNTIVQETSLVPSYGYVVKNTGVAVLRATINMAMRLHQARLETAQVVTYYEAIFDGIMTAAFVIVPGGDGKLVYLKANRCLGELVGIPAERFAGRTAAEMFGATEGSRMESRYRECLDTGRVISYAESVSGPAGTLQWHTTLTPVSTAGAVTHVLGSCVDWTVQTELEQLVQHKDSQLLAAQTGASDTLASRLLRGLPDAVFVTDPVALRIREQNAVAASMFGWPAHELTGQPLSRLLDPVSADQDLPTLICAQGRKHGFYQSALRCLTKSGDRFNTLLTALPLFDARGHTLGFVVILRDASGAQRREREYARLTTRLAELASEFAALAPAGRDSSEDSAPGEVPEFTQRQTAIARLLAQGFSNKEIARVLELSESTIKNHLSAMFRLFGVNNRVDFLRKANERQLKDRPD